MIHACKDCGREWDIPQLPALIPSDEPAACPYCHCVVSPPILPEGEADDDDLLGRWD